MNKKIDNPADCEMRSAIRFLNAQNVLLVEFMPQGTTINAESYCATLRRLRYAIQNRRRGILSSSVMLLHDNAHLHTAARTQAMLQEFGWEIFEHPAYSPDLAPSDFHLFPKLKEFLG
jgi:histone-lysine N-methyltransferase SETMAR